jgi:hypothetical protein
MEYLAKAAGKAAAAAKAASYALSGLSEVEVKVRYSSLPPGLLPNHRSLNPSA